MRHTRMEPIEGQPSAAASASQLTHDEELAPQLQQQLDVAKQSIEQLAMRLQRPDEEQAIQMAGPASHSSMEPRGSSSGEDSSSMEPYRGGGGEGSSSMEPYRSGGGEGGFADAADLSEIAPSHRGLNAHAAAVYRPQRGGSTGSVPKNRGSAGWSVGSHLPRGGWQK